MKGIDENKNNMAREVVETSKLERAMKLLAECPVDKSWNDEELGWRAKAAEIKQRLKERFPSA